jgi:hypothetical protein
LSRRRKLAIGQGTPRVFLTIWALIWNGAVLLMLSQELPAVLDGKQPWTHLLFFVPFVIAGVFVIWLLCAPNVLAGMSGAAPGSRGSAKGARPARTTSKASIGPGGRLLGIFFIASFWNSIVSVFVGEAYKTFQAGRPEWFLVVFLTPFVLVGIGLLAATGYCFLALFNPRVQVTVKPVPVRPGDEVTVEWRFAASVERIERLSLRFQGKEQATYTVGTSTSTDTAVFFDLPLADVRGKSAIRHGTVTLRLPEDAVPSFASSHNQIVWAVTVHGDIPKWPDIKEDFPVIVEPFAAGDPRLMGASQS